MFWAWLQLLFMRGVLMLVQNYRIAQGYTMDGHKMMAVPIEPSPYSDNTLLMRTLTHFIDSNDIKTVDFIKFNDFNAVKATTLNDLKFYLTIEPNDEDEEIQQD